MSLIVRYYKNDVAAFNPEVQENMFHLKALGSFSLDPNEEITISYGIRMKHDRSYSCHITPSPFLSAINDCLVVTKTDPINGEITSTRKDYKSTFVQCNQKRITRDLKKRVL